MLFRVLVGLLLLGMPLPAAEPTARELVDRLAARDHVLQQRRRAFDYDLEITREKLNDQRAVISTSTEKVVVRGDRRPDFGTRPESTAPESEAKTASREEPFELLKILDHYDYTLDGRETVDGVSCYRVGFSPKPNMPYDNREEKVLNAVKGRLWISTGDYSLIRDQGALLHPVSVAWIFASLREMEFQFDTLTLPNGDSGPRREQYRYLVHIPFASLHERDTRTMSNYRPTGLTSAGR